MGPQSHRQGHRAPSRGPEGHTRAAGSGLQRAAPDPPQAWRPTPLRSPGQLCPAGRQTCPRSRGRSPPGSSAWTASPGTRGRQPTGTGHGTTCERPASATAAGPGGQRRLRSARPPLNTLAEAGLGLYSRGPAAPWGSAPGDPPRHSRAQRHLAPSATRSREPPGTLARCGSDVAGCAARARGPGPVQKQGACGPQRDARGPSAGTSRQQLGCRDKARPRQAARSHGHTPDPAEGLDADAGAESPHAQSGRLPSVRPSPARRTPVTAPAHSSVTNVANPAGRGGSRSSHLLLQEARGFPPAAPMGHTCGPHPRPRPVGKALWDPPRHSHVACRMWPLLGSNSPGQQHSETLGPT